MKLKKSFLLIKYALLYMVISSLGPWALGAIMTTLGSESVWYKLAIYFYLHFQYNAWFVLAAIGLMVFLLERSKVKIENRAFSKFIVLFNIGIVGTFFLSCLWASSHWSLYLLSNLGSLTLWIGLYYLWNSIKSEFSTFYLTLSNQSRFILQFLVLVFLLKLLMQTLSGIPYIAEIATSNLDVVIGYLHWFFLGFISLFLLFLASYLQWIKLSNFNLGLYLLAFILTEFLIFYRATTVVLQWAFLPNLNLYLAVASLLFSVSIIGISLQSIFAPQSKTQRF
ncbi:hypothetical protein [Psychroflexus gondwanensis]|uniref:hypothetical protein n=1 Tax=Psychroflexus gondwanensis TaxID=251 RepID=UPI001CC1CD9B|nr:hypothetical protein [Psychroflexus gondwanensis]